MAMARAPRTVAIHPPSLPPFAAAVGTGRALIFQVAVGAKEPLAIGDGYGWVGGHGKRAPSFRTNDLLLALAAEMATLPLGPQLIVGDLNCDPEDIPAYQSLLAAGFVDIGADLTFGETLPTCLGKYANKNK